MIDKEEYYKLISKLFYEAVGYLTTKGYNVNFEVLLSEYISSKKHWEFFCTHNMETEGISFSVEWNPVPPEVFFEDPDELYKVTVGVVE